MALANLPIEASAAGSRGRRQPVGFKGNLTANVVPLSLDDIASIWPPCARTISAEMNSPRPRPSLLPAPALPRRQKGLKISASISGGIGSPSLLTVNAIKSSDTLADTETGPEGDPWVSALATRLDVSC